MLKFEPYLYRDKVARNKEAGYSRVCGTLYDPLALIVLIVASERWEDLSLLRFLYIEFKYKYKYMYVCMYVCV